MKSLLVCASVAMVAIAGAQPAAWESRGIGGGGALFAPSFSPHNASVFTIATDMSALFRSTNQGASYDVVPFTEIQGNRLAMVQYTSDPLIAFCMDYTVIDGVDLVRPTKSTDGGVTWTPLAAEPTDGEAFGMWVDPTSATRLLVASYNALYISTDGGASFQQRFSFANDGNGLYVGGVFWDGADIYVGCNAGLLHSTDSGATFPASAVAGIPAGRRILSMCGAREGGTARLFATATAENTYGGMLIEDIFWQHQDVYTLDLGAASWTLRTAGLPTDPQDGLALIACAVNDIDTAFVSGQRGSVGELPMIFKTTNGGANWGSVFTDANNANTATGWGGDGGDRGWFYDGGPVGFAVAPNNPQFVAFSGYGFVHLSTDGGGTWRQAYVNPADQNPPNADTPPGRDYRGIGLEDTSVWNLTWFDSNILWGNSTDIRGIRSTDGGASWSFGYTGHTQNTSYQTVVHPTTGVGYMASSTVHDIYQTTYLTDARLNGGDGQVNFTTNKGATWQLLRDFNNPVIDVALDPNNPTRLYASVIDSVEGGIYVSDNIDQGASSTWTKLANPPRTEGHPFIIRVLNDGTLAVSYSARRTNVFTQSSGVFVSDNDGASWADRSHANMTYYVKDLIIDPHDAAQNTWYAGVWSGYGGPLSTNNQAGGLYRTTNRGVNWTRIWESHRVSSIGIHPTKPNWAYVTTEAEGLWHTINLTDPTPTLTQVAGFPFREPKRVAWNPFDPGEVWIASFGNALRVGREVDGSTASGWSVH